jgi:hypothetical protein
LVRNILKGLVGAAMLLSASAASAQDYTWTLSDFNFDKWGPNAGPWPNSEFGTSASGTLVLSRSGSGYILSSYNFTTTMGDSGLSAVYDSSITEDYQTNPIAFQSFIDMHDVPEETRFRLVWPANALIDEMDAEALDSEIELGGNTSREYQSGGNRRFNGTGAQVCIIESNFQQICRDANAGILTLTSITNVPEPPVVNTPEPGTMAILGAGLLGLFAARRRRAA